MTICEADVAGIPFPPDLGRGASQPSARPPAYLAAYLPGCYLWRAGRERNDVSRRLDFFVLLALGTFVQLGCFAACPLARRSSGEKRSGSFASAAASCFGVCDEDGSIPDRDLLLV